MASSSTSSATISNPQPQVSFTIMASSSTSSSTTSSPRPQDDRAFYLPLYKAALVGDWETAKEFLYQNQGAETAVITPFGETVLHLAAGTKNTHFVQELVDRLPSAALILQNYLGSTALNIAVTDGNTDIVKILLEKNPNLLSIPNNRGDLPILLAVCTRNRDTLLYLQSVCCPADYAGQNAVDLFTLTICSGFFDIALDLVNNHAHAATLESLKFKDPLFAIAEKNSSFRSGMRLNFLESFIYSCVDKENPTTGSQTLVHGGASTGSVPLIKNIRQKKIRHHQALQLVRCLLEGIISLNNESIGIRRTLKPTMKAAELGVTEVIEEIVDKIPHAIWWSDGNNHYILQVAVKNRCEKVFNLIHQMSGYERVAITSTMDTSGNCILHLAGQLAPQHKLNLVSGAALQMQRELQWFQEVEKFVDPVFWEFRNSSDETPAMVFTREHKELVVQGEKWMKDTANSCTIAATLIITIVFAAAITVPGGNNGDIGFPIFSNRSGFWLFAVSDSISFFTSTTSLLMFLSILTARYAEEDFLHALPKRLVWGLLTLFLSITSMIIAFSTTIYLVFGEKKGWIIIPLAILSCLPITSFVTLQFPLLIDVYSSTYGHGIFGKQGNHPLR